MTTIDFTKLPPIDLLIGGSPCQDFSRANKERLGLNGSKSSLFDYYLKAFQILEPKYFILENVIMDEYGYKYISDCLGTYPVRINSSLVSAQLRDRLYWTNIGDFYYDLLGYRYSSIPQPIDKKLKLNNILDSGYTDRIKARALLESDSRPLKDQRRMLYRYIETGMTTVIFENEEFMKNIIKNRIGWDNYLCDDQTKIPPNTIRYFSQTEMEKLQTVPVGYTKMVTRNKAASLIGDGWTVDVISHILQFM